MAISHVVADSNGYLRTHLGGSALGGINAQALQQSANRALPSVKLIDPNAVATDLSLEGSSAFVMRSGNYTAVPFTNGTLFVSNFAQATSGATAYESSALYAQSMTVDSSAAADKDAVGADCRGVIYSTNTTGRAWGLFAAASTLDNTADGRLCAAELGVINRATVDQTAINTATSKLGLLVTASGTQRTTAAIQLLQDGSTFHRGITCDVLSITPLATNASARFIELLSGGACAFGVDQIGRVIQLKSAPASQAFGAVTSNGISGVLTLTGTIGAGAEDSATVVSNTYVTATSQIFTQLGSGCTNAANSTVNVQITAQGAGTFTLRLINGSGTSTGACTLVIHYWVINQ